MYQPITWTASVGAGRTYTVGPTSILVAVGDSTYRGLLLYNSGTVPIYVALGSTVSTATFTRMLAPSGGYWEIGDSYQGPVAAITVGGTGQLQVTFLMPAGFSGVAA